MARMDATKAAIASVVQELLDQDGTFGDLVREKSEGLLSVEPHHISPTETMIRVKGEGMPGMPRYFLVKVSEQS